MSFLPFKLVQSFYSWIKFPAKDTSLFLVSRENTWDPRSTSLIPSKSNWSTQSATPRIGLTAAHTLPCVLKTHLYKLTSLQHTLSVLLESSLTDTIVQNPRKCQYKKKKKTPLNKSGESTKPIQFSAGFRGLLDQDLWRETDFQLCTAPTP